MQVKKHIFFNISHYIYMIDLLDESGEDLSSLGYKTKELGKYAVKLSRMKVEKSISDFDEGEYVIISSPFIHDLDDNCKTYTANIIKRELKKIVGKTQGRALLVGLGNPDILADSLGVKIVNSLELKDDMYKFCPNIFMNTGIDSFEIIQLLTKWLDVDYVIIIDSLATTNIKRLGVSLQINSAGMTPGSAVNNLGRKINSKTLGVPCFAIGVPLMLIEGDLLLTPKDIRGNLDNLVEIFSSALNDLL